ncbi:MAG: hypothetical protein DMF61_11840 [Blastocatellia bacterium AA13]|nr:MAG: hypothetical protein DMF61_11840 [Blastocatellia bacterium AA13]
MASQKKPGETFSEKQGDNPSEKSSTPTQGPEDVLKPFQDASAKFAQAHLAAQESAVKKQAHTWLDLQDKIRKIEQDAYNAVTEATRKHLSNLGEQTGGSLEDAFAARAQAQIEYEKQVRQIYADTEAKLRELADKSANEQQGSDPVTHFTNRRQDAYQAYLADLQQAWSNTKNLDPQTVNAIASNILSTINIS